VTYGVNRPKLLESTSLSSGKGPGVIPEDVLIVKFFRKSLRVNLTLNPSPHREGLVKLLILSKIFSPFSRGERGRGIEVNG
jgi:hypothetical protein